ncbi:MAG TPA: hypothetical protein VH372_16820 [Actinospica sp.]|nr:hypothetical protein [Actinospica sp.]
MTSTIALLRNLKRNLAIAVAARKPISVATSTVAKVTTRLLRNACQKLASVSTARNASSENWPGISCGCTE